MDTTDRLRGMFIALMEDALEASSLCKSFPVELTITPSPAPPFMQSTMRSFRLGSVTREELSSILQSLRASNALTSSNTQE